MGFGEVEARAALVNNNWDENAAVNALVASMGQILRPVFFSIKFNETKKYFYSVSKKQILIQYSKNIILLTTNCTLLLCFVLLAAAELRMKGLFLVALFIIMKMKTDKYAKIQSILTDFS